MVNYVKLVQAGRLVFITNGPYAKKVALIVEIIDQNRVLIDGPCSGVPRQAIGLRNLHLSRVCCKLPHGCGTRAVKKIWEKNDISGQWSKTTWARKLERKALRAKMTDFDRFKVMVARQKMVNYVKLVQAGRLVFITNGPYAKKVALIVEIIDQNRVLIDGPCSGVPRQAIGLRNLHLSRVCCKLPHGCGTRAVKKIWEKNDISGQWSKTTWARKLERKALRAKMTDFDRFKVMVARQKRNRLLKAFRIRKPVVSA
ncbi:unnamed protein product [Calicophoron daubneyi]|uniref:Large ribosomal subunit protein eL14 n=1 Tax=Calicophoron daubneyi TaxID=300641 RepID=A0AAV2TRU6_CALDB